MGKILPKGKRITLKLYSKAVSIPATELDMAAFAPGRFQRMPPRKGTRQPEIINVYARDIILRMLLFVSARTVPIKQVIMLLQTDSLRVLFSETRFGNSPLQISCTKQVLIIRKVALQDDITAQRIAAITPPLISAGIRSIRIFTNIPS